MALCLATREPLLRPELEDDTQCWEDQTAIDPADRIRIDPLDRIRIDPYHLFAAAPKWVVLRTVGSDFRSLCNARREFLKWWSDTGGCGLCREERRYTFREPLCGWCWMHRAVQPKLLTVGYCTRKLCSSGILPIWFNGWHHGMPLDAWFDVAELPEGCFVVVPERRYS